MGELAIDFRTELPDGAAVPIPAAGDTSRPPRFIINVSAMEGKFYRQKTAAHPHTNMAKAALNMLTRTSAQVRKPIANSTIHFVWEGPYESQYLLLFTTVVSAVPRRSITMVVWSAGRIM
jgi:NAD(P)-dependent dehydrogenase (short-subunit alcohol dehydrogenase family)